MNKRWINAAVGVVISAVLVLVGSLPAAATDEVTVNMRPDVIILNSQGDAEEVAAQIDLPVCREILLKQVPMLLRAQQPDGGWGEHSFHVFAALERQGLMEELRSRPTLPPDWKVTLSFPAPEGDLCG